MKHNRPKPAIMKLIMTFLLLVIKEHRTHGLKNVN